MNKPAGRFVVRSLAAVATGWFVPAIVVCALANGDGVAADPFARFMALSWIMGMWMIPSWLLVVLPLTLFVSEDSKFWHPLIAGPVGLIVGGVILFGSFGGFTARSGDLQWNSLISPLTIACAAGLMTGLALAYLFRNRMPNNFPHPTPPSRRG